MEVRNAERKDFYEIQGLFKDFANAAPVEYYHNPQYNVNHINKTFDYLRIGGIFLVAETDDKIIGFLMAGAVDDVWLPNKKTMRELAWWVDPEYRTTSAGGRLFLEYQNQCEQLLQVDTIVGYTMTMLEESPSINLEKRGMNKIESIYMRTA
jgi:L-amino acid N-acyltransferase YncA